jgi:replicative DNA helicase
MIDVVLLRILRASRGEFQKIYPLLPRSEGTLDKKTLAIADDFKKYYDAMPSHKEIDLQTFLPRFKGWHPTMKEDELNVYYALFRNIVASDADDDQKRLIHDELSELNMVTRLANLVARHEAGEVENTFSMATGIIDDYRLSIGQKKDAYVSQSIEELLREEFEDTGIEWRLSALNRSTRKLRPGDFGIIAGRPDKGKTSFIASEITHMAAQMPKGRPIIWLNNEGPGRRIKPRLYQAALNLGMEDMKRLSREGKLVPMFRKAMGGDMDKIKVFDIHGWNNGQVEMIIAEQNPGMIIYDMIDSIRGFGDEARTDLGLEKMYQWARERSVKYDCIGLATSQISNEGDGLQFPTLGMLKDSKTGKQGACDFMVMIGASNDPAMNGSRFISMPKNKIRRPDGIGDPRAEVLFDGRRSRFNDITDRALIAPEGKE